MRGRHAHGAGVVDLERDEVALVDADERGPGGQRPLELGLVVDLDERVEPELGGQRRGSRASSLVGERGGDEQHRVGAHQAGVADVGAGDGEVLAQHGQRRLAARASARSAGDPPKNSRSVSTERHAAPPSS